MMKVDKISKTFYREGQPFPVLNEISLTLNPNSILGLLGPNGAGKTTALRIMAGLLSADAGMIYIHEKPFKEKDLELKKKIGFLSSGTQLYPLMNALEIFNFFGKLYNLSNTQIKNRSDELIQTLDLHKFCKSKIQNLSTGQKQRVNIARAIFHNPDILILDEPTNGLDILSSSAVLEIIRKFSRENKCVIYSSHILSEIELLADEISIIYSGKILINSNRTEIISKYECETLSQAFLLLIHQADKQIGNTINA